MGARLTPRLVLLNHENHSTTYQSSFDAVSVCLDVYNYLACVMHGGSDFCLYPKQPQPAAQLTNCGTHHREWKPHSPNMRIEFKEYPSIPNKSCVYLLCQVLHAVSNLQLKSLSKQRVEGLPSPLIGTEGTDCKCSYKGKPEEEHKDIHVLNKWLSLSKSCL